MITNEALSLSQKAKGRKSLLLFSFLNGAALTFITGNVLSLYLLKVGCSIPLVAVIASFAYLGTLFAFTGKSFIAKLGAAATLRWAWIFCGFAAIVLAIAPFLAHWIHYDNIVIPLIICITFLFFIFKSIGTASTQPLMGEFTDEENQGEFSSKYFLYYTTATVLAIVITICLITGHKTLFVFQLIISLGGIIILGCSFIFIGMKETKVPCESARSIVTKKLLSTIWLNKEYRRFLYCRSLSRAGMILIIPISILALKKIYGVSDQIALTFAFVQLAGGIITTYINGIVSEETGPKPLIIIYTLLLFVISLLWIFAPLKFHWNFCLIIFFTGGVCLCGLDSCLNHYYLTLIPRKHSVGISLWYTVISGAVAGVAGLLLGGGLIKLLSVLVPHLEVFRYYYGIMFLLTIPILYISFKLKAISDWTFKDVLKLSVTPSEMHTIYAMHRLQKYSTLREELKHVHTLETMDPSLSQDKIIYYLQSPRFSVKIRALRALYGAHLKQATVEAVFNELKYGEYTTAYFAVVLLADNHKKEAIPFLIKYLNSKDLLLVSTCMQGLVKLHDTKSYPKIIKIFRNAKMPQILIHGATALSNMGDVSLLKDLLDKFVDIITNLNSAISKIEGKKPVTHRESASTMYIRRTSVNNEIICSTANLAGIGDEFYKFLRIYDHNHQNGILALAEMLTTVNPCTDLENPLKILLDYNNGSIKVGKVLEFLRASAKYTKKNNPIISPISAFLEQVSPKIVTNKLIYCFFLVLFRKGAKS